MPSHKDNTTAELMKIIGGGGPSTMHYKNKEYKIRIEKNTGKTYLLVGREKTKIYVPSKQQKKIHRRKGGGGNTLKRLEGCLRGSNCSEEEILQLLEVEQNIDQETLDMFLRYAVEKHMYYADGKTYYQREFPNIVTALLKKGARVSEKALDQAALLNKPNLLAILLTDMEETQGKYEGVDLTKYKNTALVTAVEHYSLPCVKRLLAAGADPNTKDNRGRSVLAIAASHEKYLVKVDEITKDLQHRAAPKFIEGDAPYSMFPPAAYALQCVTLLLEQPQDVSNITEALHVAMDTYTDFLPFYEKKKKDPIYKQDHKDYLRINVVILRTLLERMIKENRMIKLPPILIELAKDIAESAKVVRAPKGTELPKSPKNPLGANLLAYLKSRRQKRPDDPIFTNLAEGLHKGYVKASA